MGDDFNEETGRITCEIPSLYLFTNLKLKNFPPQQKQFPGHKLTEIPFFPSVVEVDASYSFHVHTNMGDDFEEATGQFTSEIHGLYLFTYSKLKNFPPQHTISWPQVDQDSLFSFCGRSGCQYYSFHVQTYLGDDFNEATGRFTCEIPSLHLFTYLKLKNFPPQHSISWPQVDQDILFSFCGRSGYQYSFHVHTNMGDDFEEATGQFTSEIHGLYLFTYSKLKNFPPQETISWPQVDQDTLFPSVVEVDASIAFMFTLIWEMTLMKQQDDSHVRFLVFIYSLTV